jgi:hypothetical protein
MSSAASLALGETCTEKNDARNERALLIPMRSQAASAVCVRDPGSRSGLKTKPRLSVPLFIRNSLGSGLIDQSQKATAAAMQIAEK